MENKNMSCQDIVNLFMNVVDDEFNILSAKAKKIIMSHSSEVIGAKLALFLHENDKYKDEDKAVMTSIYVARLIILYHLENIGHMAKKDIFEKLNDDSLFESVFENK